jgi:hypothetical protein
MTMSRGRATLGAVVRSDAAVIWGLQFRTLLECSNADTPRELAKWGYESELY